MKKPNSSYVGDIIQHYNGNYPAWTLIEIVSFGDYLRFYKFCANRWNDKDLLNDFYLMKDVKELRNFAFKLELIENINGIFISANSDFQIGAKKVTEYKQIKLIKFNELNKIIDGLDSEYLIPTSKTIGDPFWMFMDKNGYNTIKQNYFLKEGILLFESKYFAKQFQKTYLNNRGKNIELVGVSQDHLKEIMYLKKKKNIKVRMFNTYFYILNEQCNCFFDLSIEDLQMYVR